MYRSLRGAHFAKFHWRKLTPIAYECESVHPIPPKLDQDPTQNHVMVMEKSGNPNKGSQPPHFHVVMFTRLSTWV